MRWTAEVTPPLTATTRTVLRSSSRTVAVPSAFGVTLRVATLPLATVVTRSVVG